MSDLLTKQRLAYPIVPLLCYLGARFANIFSVAPEGIGLLWLPTSVVLAALLFLNGQGFWRLLLLGFAAEVLAEVSRFSLTEAVLFGLMHALEAGLAYWLLRRWNFSPSFATLADLGRFMLAGPVIAAFSAAVLATLIYSPFRGGPLGDLEWLRLWWFRDLLGLIVCVPVFLTAWPAAEHAAARPAWRRADLLVGLAAVVVVVLMLAARDGMLAGVRIAPGLLLLLVIYVAARFDVRSTALAAGAAALFIVVLVAANHQPFGVMPARTAVIETQRYIVVMNLTALGLAALLAQIRAQQAILAAANERLSQLNHDLEARVAERTAELQALNATLEELAQTDALTGLLNRRAFLAAAEREVERSRRHRHPLAILMIDMDYFKAINDQYGHPAGDLVLQRTATLIAGVIRVSDLLARFGGEEFVLLAPETSLENARVLAARVQQAVREQTIAIEQGTVQTTVSLGLTMLHEAGEDVGRLIQRADGALYAAKGAGRDRIVTLAAEATPSP